MGQTFPYKIYVPSIDIFFRKLTFLQPPPPTTTTTTTKSQFQMISMIKSGTQLIHKSFQDVRVQFMKQNGLFLYWFQVDQRNQLQIQALKSDVRLQLWLTPGLTKTIPQESFQICDKVLLDSCHKMIIFITICFWIIDIHLSFISSNEQKVLKK